MPSSARDRKPKFFKWTVEFAVHESWVADGFDLTDERALAMLSDDLTIAYGSELKARVIKYPKAIDVAKAQGYADASSVEAKRAAEKAEA